MNSEEVEIKCPCGEGCNEPVSEREMRAVGQVRLHVVYMHVPCVFLWVVAFT